MICHQLKLIFVHPPKTAGHSIESAIMDFLHVPWEDRRELGLGYNANPEYGPPVLDHLTAPEYRHFGYVSRNTWEHYLKVATIRNPFDRLLSEWRFRKHRIPFRDFVMRYFPVPAWTDEYVHVISQTEFLGLHTEHAVDAVVRFEHLREDFTLFCEWLGIPFQSLPHRRKSEKIGSLNYRDWYDEEMVVRVGDLYHDDFVNLGYSFDIGGRHDNRFSGNVVSGCRGMLRDGIGTMASDSHQG